MTVTPNERQQRCIENLKGKYLVLAGPGTGKTFTIIERIKAIINSGTLPEKILCLTYTDAAAREMKKRLEKDLNTIDSGVNVYTYHGFCNNLINDNVEEFELPNNYKIISNAITYKFLKECIDEVPISAYRTKRNDPYYYISEISDCINEIKKNRLTKEQFFYNLKNHPDWEPKKVELDNEFNKRLVAGKVTKSFQSSLEKIEKKLRKMNELWNIYEMYSFKMEQEHYLDFDDMISMVLDRFENHPDFLEKVAENYEYILVDEYQDTNKSQNDIVFNLAKTISNVFVVGDDDQIIFTFQGAKQDTIKNYLNEFPDTQVICLNENMRSTQNILDVARKIAKQDYYRIEDDLKFNKYNITKDLIAKNEELKNKNIKVRYTRYADVLHEYNSIIEEIEELIDSKDCPIDSNGDKNLSEIAIIMKSNAELASMSEMLKSRNIPYELKDGKSIFEIKSSIILYYYLQMLIDPEMFSDNFFKLLLSQPFNINPTDYEVLIKAKSKYVSFVYMFDKIKELSFLEPEKIYNFVDTFKYLLEYKNNETLKNIILETGAKTGIFDYFFNSKINQVENISGLTKIVDESSAFQELSKKITLEDFVEYLNMSFNENLPILTDKAPIPMNAIQLTTYHSSKGREFEYVYMPTLIKDNWESDSSSLKPIIPLSPKEAKSDQEWGDLKRSGKIKLLFVGMTRAKHTLRISYPQLINGKPKNPSWFIAEIFDMFESFDKADYTLNSFWEEQSKKLLKRTYDYNRDFCSMVNSRLAEKPFSPSAVNLYLNCPRQYFYKYILRLESKSGSSDALSYGTAVHSACEYAVNYAINNGEYPSKKDFISEFKKQIDELPFSSYSQRIIHLERGELALNDYYTQFISTPISMLYKTEYKLEFEMDGIKFFGIIDRIEKNSDGTYSIYDYKTGSAKNEKIISVGGEHEDYYNQIGLYKYFFEKVTGAKVRDTGFIFPEEFKDNLYLNLTNQECECIVEKFKSAIADIKSYKFEPNQCEKSCKYCQYNSFCNLEIV